MIQSPLQIYHYQYYLFLNSTLVGARLAGWLRPQDGRSVMVGLLDYNEGIQKVRGHVKNYATVLQVHISVLRNWCLGVEVNLQPERLCPLALLSSLDGMAIRSSRWLSDSGPRRSPLQQRGS